MISRHRRNFPDTDQGRLNENIAAGYRTAHTIVGNVQQMVAAVLAGSRATGRRLVGPRDIARLRAAIDELEHGQARRSP